MTKTKANWLLMAAALIWGSGYIFTKMGTNAGLEAGTINAIRGLLYAALAYAFFHRAIHRMTRTDFLVGLVAGTLNFIAFQLQTVGLMYTTPANNAFLTAIYVVMTPFIVWVVYRERPEAKSYLAILICMVGMAILTNVVGGGFQLHLGDLLTIASAFFYALQIVYFGMRATAASPWVVAFMLGLVQGLGGLLWAVLFESGSWARADWQAGLWPVIVLGLCSSFGAQTLQVVGQRYTDPTPAGLILMAESLFGSIFSVALGFEPFTVNLVVGGGLIILALLIMQVGFRRLWRMRRRA